MKKKIIGIFVCMLLIATAIPVVGTMNIVETEMRNTNDTQELTVEIIHPKNGLYFKTNKIIPLSGATMVIGDSGIEVKVKSEMEIKTVAFYVDDKLLGSLNKPPWEYKWDERAFFSHTITVKAIDVQQQSAQDDVKAFILNFNLL